jgi:hypothetical protein
MKKETIKNIIHFLEDNEGKKSFLWKLLNDEPFTEDELNIRGDLDLSDLEIETLPKGLKVGGALFTWGTPLEEFSDNELIEMVKPGFIRGKIYR